MNLASRYLWRKRPGGHRMPMAAVRAGHASGARAFTLVELLVAVGLTAMLLWGLLQLYTQATRFSSAMFAEAELCAGGRAVLERLCHELASAATLDSGYLKITDYGVLDTIQFVAPVGDDGAPTHVKYYVEGGKVCRATKAFATDDTYETSVTGGSSLGVTAQRFQIEHIPAGTSDGEPVTTSGSWHDPDTQNLPRAILVEIQLNDPKGRASITLSSGAYLGGSGN